MAAARTSAAGEVVLMAWEVAVIGPRMPIVRVRGHIVLGTQGWNYPAWVGPFYPAGTRPADFLRLYARAFRSVEVDSTFYAVPPESTVLGWAERVDDGFQFALKLPRSISHERGLVNCGDLVAEFVDRVRLLGSKLGPILIQLGPEFGPDRMAALEGFLPLLPSDLRFAVEFRDRGWIGVTLRRLLSAHNVAVALVEGRWIPRGEVLELAERPTADFAYVRFMGPDRRIEDYSRVQVDRTAVLAGWAGPLAALAARVTAVHTYVNNHFEGHSPDSVRRLQGLLGERPFDPRQLAEQRELF